MAKVDEHYPGLYDRSACDEPRDVDLHRPPSDWIANRNPGWPGPGRTTNCGDCARASESTWRGIDTQAGALADPEARGEVVDVMEKWSDGDLVPANFDAVRDELEALGPGSSALVLIYWDTGGGHWINAFNENGAVTAADGQRARSEPWPPTDAGLRFQEADCKASFAVFIDPDGRHMRADTPEEGEDDRR